MSTVVGGIRWSRIMVSLLAAAALIGASAGVSSYLVTRQLRSLLKPHPAEPAATDASSKETVIDVDFYRASGIAPRELLEFLEETAARDHLHEFPVHLGFLNADGEALVDHPVTIEWNSGRDVVNVGQSGVLRVMLRADLLPGLKFRVPAAYSRLVQHTVPLGTAYEPYVTTESKGLGRFVVFDYDVAVEMWRQLARQRAAGEGLSAEAWRAQIRRTHCRWTPPVVESLTAAEPAEIFRRRRDAVVVIGHLLPDGVVVHAAGVVVDPAGVIATAYHVIDKPDAVARAVLTADGRAYPIEEILAANRPNDAVLIRIAARGLTAASLSTGDDEGSPLTIVSHPAGEFYSVTAGHLRRFHTTVAYGRQVVQMAVTADFADGASGGPVFNSRGEVAGIVSFRRPTGTADAAHVAVPARALWELLEVAP